MSLHLSPIVEALDLLDTAAAELDEQLPRALEAGQSRARLLAHLDGALDRLRALRSLLERDLAAGLRPRQRPYDVDGVLLRVSGGLERVWLDPRQLAWRVIEPAVADPESGEVFVDEDAARRLLDRLLTVLPHTKEGDPNPGFRVGGLVELGVEFADLADWRERRRTVAVVHTEAAT